MDPAETQSPHLNRYLTPASLALLAACGAIAAHSASPAAPRATAAAPTASVDTAVFAVG